MGNANSVAFNIKILRLNCTRFENTVHHCLIGFSDLLNLLLLRMIEQEAYRMERSLRNLETEKARYFLMPAMQCYNQYSTMTIIQVTE